MQELHNQLLASTDPLEIIEISDKILYERLRRYINHTFIKGESFLSLGKFDEALSIFEHILEYNDDRFTGRAHNSIRFCYSMKNKPRKAESEFKKARKYCDKSSLLLNSATLNMAAYYSMTNKKEDVYKIFKELSTEAVKRLNIFAGVYKKPKNSYSSYYPKNDISSKLFNEKINEIDLIELLKEEYAD